MYIHVINGPNLNLLGCREPEIYGKATLEDVEKLLTATFEDKVQLTFFQSNSEGGIIEAIQKAGIDSNCAGIVLNAGAYTHYSHAIADAIAAVPAKVVEVHISNPLSRESFRHTSVIGPVCAGTVSGFGIHSYILAVEALLLNRGQE